MMAQRMMVCLALLAISCAPDSPGVGVLRQALSTTYKISPNLATNPAVHEYHSLDDLGTVRATRGDRILFESGYTYTGKLAIRQAAGATAGSVYVGVYNGTTQAHLRLGRSPTSYGVTRWTYDAHPDWNNQNIWTLNNNPVYRMGPFPAGTAPRMLYYNGVRKRIAAHPNVPSDPEWPGTGSSPDYFRTTWRSDYDPVWCQAAACLGGDWTQDPTWALRTFGRPSNCFAAVRNSNWSLLRSSLIWHSPTKNDFALADSLRTPENGYALPDVGYGFILFNHLAWMDSPGEWYWDPLSRNLWFYTDTGGAPLMSLTTVAVDGEGPIVDVDLTGAQTLDITIEDIDAQQSATDVMIVQLAGSATVRRCTAAYAEGNGLVLGALSNASVYSSYVGYNASNGISAWGITGTLRVEGNTVDRNGRLSNQAALGMALNGISESLNGTVEINGNNIYQSGGNGISAGPSTTRFHVGKTAGGIGNSFNMYCMLVNDCGGVYYNATGDTVTTTWNKFIEDNDFQWGWGNTDGTPAGMTQQAAAIYLDWRGSYFQVYRNTVHNSYAWQGSIYFNGGNYNNIQWNNVDSPYYGAAGVRHDYSCGGTLCNYSDHNWFNANTLATSGPGGVMRFIDQDGHVFWDFYQGIGTNTYINRGGGPTFEEVR